MGKRTTGKQVECIHCGHEWQYKGNGTFYITCPRCYNKIKIFDGILPLSDTTKSTIYSTKLLGIPRTYVEWTRTDPINKARIAIMVKDGSAYVQPPSFFTNGLVQVSKFPRETYDLLDTCEKIIFDSWVDRGVVTLVTTATPNKVVKSYPEKYPKVKV